MNFVNLILKTVFNSRDCCPLGSLFLYFLLRLPRLLATGSREQVGLAGVLLQPCIINLQSLDPDQASAAINYRLEDCLITYSIETILETSNRCIQRIEVGAVNK